MNQTLTFLQIFCVLVIFIFGLFYFGSGAYFNIIKLGNMFSVSELLGMLLLVLLALGLLYIFSSLPIQKRYFLVLLLPTAFIIRLFWIIYAPTEPTSDFLMLYNAAVSAASGDLSFADNTYFTKWVYQLGFVMYEAFAIAIFGNETFILKILNALYSTGIVWIVYECARHIFNEKAGRLAGATYTLYVPAIIMTSVLTNQVLATLLFYAGVLLLIKRFEKSRYSWIYIGLLFAFGHIIRPVGSLVLLASGFFLLVVYLLNHKKSGKLLASLKFAGMIAVYFLTLTASSQALMISGVSDHPLENRDPKWKFVLGLNQETTGQYSKKDSLALRGLSLEERQAKEDEMIQERLSDKSALLPLFRDKFGIMWSNKDASILWSYQGGDKETKDLLYKSEKIMFTTFFFLGFISLILLSWSYLSKRDEVDFQRFHSLWFILFLIGYALIHLVIEIQTRYRFVSIPSIIILQSYSHYLLFKRWRKKKSLSP
ncbi:Dolichyl-phosphate-mannose-protein mannosyltransferase [Halobacillus karajensis]|uniref:glycosyltransferase family 39 protein n=1 Tax=Halobacillus karajensis TaxID=195088 RepID=UPI0008A7E0DD|nr:glycosyltransferase family 39 protein [Halobacillus karajensis]SEH44467.1 Dolichyl-phosphate-mannose-protein mannosyltransferase [Halobacillus karajensis]